MPRDKIVLEENGELISDDAKVAETFNDFFSDTIKTLDITENRLLLNPVELSEKGVEKCIKMYESHPSILIIKRMVSVESEFEFYPVTTEDMEKRLAALDTSKNSGCIPTRVLKQVRHIVSKPMVEIWTLNV